MKTYIKPETTVVKIQQQRALLTTSDEVSSINSPEFSFGGGSFINARTRENSVWDEEW